MKSLFKLLSKLPTNEHVTFRIEEKDEGDIDVKSDGPFLSMCLYIDAPEDGWKTEGDRFGHPPGFSSHARPCPATWKHDDMVVFGVSGELDEWKAFGKNCKRALKNHLKELTEHNDDNRNREKKQKEVSASKVV